MPIIIEYNHDEVKILPYLMLIYELPWFHQLLLQITKIATLDHLGNSSVGFLPNSLWMDGVSIRLCLLMWNLILLTI